MATSRVAAGSLFGAVTSSAEAITNLAQTLSGSILISKNYVDKIRKEQEFQYKHDLMEFEATVELRAVQKTVDLAFEIQKSCKDPEYKNLYEEALKNHRDKISSINN